jgi:hypothetical protein
MRPFSAPMGQASLRSSSCYPPKFILLPLDETRARLFGEERWSVWDVRKKLGSSLTICSGTI